MFVHTRSANWKFKKSVCTQYLNIFRLFFLDIFSCFIFFSLYLLTDIPLLVVIVPFLQQQNNDIEKLTTATTTELCKSNQADNRSLFLKIDVYFLLL